jgi:nitrous oxidase accessory protein NosD
MSSWISRGLTTMGALALACGIAGAAPIPVAPGESLPAALDAAAPGDVLELSAGIYSGDLDFGGKAVTVVGVGPETVLMGSGGGSVVRFSSGEGPASVLDSVAVTGGLAARGGGIHIADASPTVRRTVVFGNRAALQGSGIYVARSNAILRNNLIAYNSTGGGDPHALEIVDAGPAVLNNTIVRNDSNGVILRGSSPADIRNNVIAVNGSRGRGRGICDFSGGVARIHYNLFWQNRVAALLTNGIDFRRVGSAERVIGLPRLIGNVDGSPSFLEHRPPRLDAGDLTHATLLEVVAAVRLDASARRRNAIDAGDPSPEHADRDGTPNDLGFTGGPESPAW